jgi:hypothetical protein
MVRSFFIFISGPYFRQKMTGCSSLPVKNRLGMICLALVQLRLEISQLSYDLLLLPAAAPQALTALKFAPFLVQPEQHSDTAPNTPRALPAAELSGS